MKFEMFMIEIVRLSNGYAVYAGSHYDLRTDQKSFPFAVFATKEELCGWLQQEWQPKIP